MLDLYRKNFQWLEKALAGIFSPLPLAPNHYTLLSILSVAACAYLLASGRFIWAILYFLLAAFLDLVDGAVARSKNLATRKGAYFDTVADRYVDAILLFGFLFLRLPDIILPSYFWIFLALLGSTMTTYAKAAAKEKGLVDSELRGGLMSRAERMILYFAALTALNFNLFWVVYILAALAILSNMTAIQRIRMALGGKEAEN